VKSDRTRLLVDAVAFAAHKHRRQQRKVAEASPYINHPIALEEHGAAYGPIKPETRAPLIATSDIPRVAADVIQDTTWSGVQVRELLGPRDYSFAEAAKIIGEAAGKPVNFVQVPADQARQAMAGMGLGKSITDKYLEMYSGMESGRVGSETGRSAQSTTPTRLEDFARQALAPAIRG
jgi:uncharacterized protein YbjT (DUF2867 family)